MLDAFRDRKITQSDTTGYQMTLSVATLPEKMEQYFNSHMNSDHCTAVSYMCYSESERSTIELETQGQSQHKNWQAMHAKLLVNSICS